METGRIHERALLLRVGGWLAGVALGLLLPVVGWADPAGNTACTHFCTDTFPGQSARGQCTSDAAHGAGTCFVCGPSAPAGHPDACGVGTAAARCCPANTPSCCPANACVSLSTDVANCGACGHACTAPENATPTCTAGICGFTCNAGFDGCGGACCSTTTQVCVNQACEHCGGNTDPCCSGNTCAQDLSCQSGVCCPGGSVNCGGSCCATNSNLCVNDVCVHCGGNGVQCCAGDSCAQDLSCQSGVCCPGGSINCGGSCCATNSNLCVNGVCQLCGANGVQCCAGDSCAQGLSCQSGVCRPT